MLTELFAFRFISPLTAPRSRELRLLTGMRIGDVQNPFKDTPGSGRVAGSVHLTLARGQQQDEWYLTASTHDLAGADLEAVATLRQRLLVLLPSLTQNWEALDISSPVPLAPRLSDARSFDERGIDHVSRMRYAEAIADFTCAIALDPRQVDYFARRAATLRRQDRIEEALRDYSHALALRPEDVRILSARASVYAGIERYDQALADLNSAISLDSSVPASHAKMGLIYYELGHFDVALSAFDKAISRDSHNADFFFYRGCAAYQLERYQLAAEDFARAAAISDTLQLVTPYHVWFNQGAALTHLHQFRDAAAAITQAIVTNPEAGDLLALRGSLYDRAGEYELAVADFNRALQLDPLDAELYNNRGIAYAELMRCDLAIADFNQAILLKPTEERYLRNRAVTLGRLGSYDQALVDYERAVLLDPTNADLYTSRGTMYFAKSDYQRALADFEAALGIDAGDPSNHSRLGALLAHIGRRDEALPYLDHAALLGDADAAVLAQDLRSAQVPATMASSLNAPTFMLSRFGMAAAAPAPLMGVSKIALADAA